MYEATIKSADSDEQKHIAVTDGPGKEGSYVHKTTLKNSKYAKAINYTKVSWKIRKTT